MSSRNSLRTLLSFFSDIPDSLSSCQSTWLHPVIFTPSEHVLEILWNSDINTNEDFFQDVDKKTGLFPILDAKTLTFSTFLIFQEPWIWNLTQPEFLG